MAARETPRVITGSTGAPRRPVLLPAGPDDDDDDDEVEVDVDVRAATTDEAACFSGGGSGLAGD